MFPFQAEADLDTRRAGRVFFREYEARDQAEYFKQKPNKIKTIPLNNHSYY
jgi:hypothetical protein